MARGNMAQYRDVTIDDVLGLLTQYRRSGKAYITSCYNELAHKNGDRKPSMAIYDDGFKCFGCDEHGSLWYLLKQLKGESMPEYPNNQPVKTKTEPVKTPPKKYNLAKIWSELPRLPEDVKDSLDEKGFYGEQFEELAGWRWHIDQIDGWGEGIFIPYKFEGKMVSARLRRIKGDPRFLSLRGHDLWPYNLDKSKKSCVYITEGESDCLTLNFIGIPAVGIPGASANTAIKKLMEECQKYNTRIIIVPDNDKAGEDFLDRVRSAAFDYKVVNGVFRVPYGKDINEWYCKASHYEVEELLASHARQKDIPTTIKPVDDTAQMVKDIFGL